MASSSEKRDIAFKHTLDVYHTRSDRQWFEEPYRTRHVVSGPDVWASKPPYNDSAAGILAGLVVEEINYTLTLDPFSDNLLWVAKTSPGSWPFSGPMTDWTTLETQRVKNWISPVVFGPAYAYTLKQNNGTPIPDGNWEILFSEGLIHLDEGYSAADMGWSTPLKLTAYRYIGKFLNEIITDHRVWYPFTQPAHGYPIGHCIIPVTLDYSTNRWVKARSNDPTTLAKGIITNVIDVNTFEITLLGQVYHPGHGLSINDYYFLDAVFPGGLVTVSPPISQPLLWVLDSDYYIVRFERPINTEGIWPTPSPSISTRIESGFDFTHFSGGSLNVGKIPANCRVSATALKIDSSFDVGSVTIGDSVAQGRLMSASENNLLFNNTYRTEKDVLYSAETDINIYFTGTPSSGSGLIVIYYSP